jgi:HTH-type transcriptional regulator/antitoxin HigA
MITNERQYRISKSQLAKFESAVLGFDLKEAAERIGSRVLAKAELDALKSECEVLSSQIQDYEALKSGAVTVLEAESLDELPSILIRARIAKGLSQRELAIRLGLQEQQIQRYESEEYASASQRRIVEVARTLGLNFKKAAEFSFSSSR